MHKHTAYNPHSAFSGTQITNPGAFSHALLPHLDLVPPQLDSWPLPRTGPRGLPLIQPGQRAPEMLSLTAGDVLALCGEVAAPEAPFRAPPRAAGASSEVAGSQGARSKRKADSPGKEPVRKRAATTGEDKASGSETAAEKKRKTHNESVSCEKARLTDAIKKAAAPTEALEALLGTAGPPIEDCNSRERKIGRTTEAINEAARQITEYRTQIQAYRTQIQAYRTQIESAEAVLEKRGPMIWGRYSLALRAERSQPSQPSLEDPYSTWVMLSPHG